MRSETCRKGEMAKSKVIFRAYEKGIIVSIPTIEVDYDLVMDIDGVLKKIQVKWCDSATRRGSEGSVFLTLRRTTRSNKQLTYSEDAVDLLMVYLPKIDKVICLPPDIWHEKSSLTIRYSKAMNNQKSKVLMAENYVW
jgi:hypothetical protein